MSWVNVTNVAVRCPNPARLDADFAFEVTFTCLHDLQEPLQWRLIYVGSADDKDKDQELECVELGPVKRGALKFTFESDPPNLDLIDPDDLWGTTVILLEASYKDQDFIRVGWYVHNVYTDPVLQDDPPDVPEPEKMLRYIVADEPRVTRFSINWMGGANEANSQANGESDRQAMFNALLQSGGGGGTPQQQPGFPQQFPAQFQQQQQVQQLQQQQQQQQLQQQQQMQQMQQQQQMQQLQQQQQQQQQQQLQMQQQQQQQLQMQQQSHSQQPPSFGPTRWQQQDIFYGAPCML